MTHVHWTEILGWLLGATILGAIVGAAIVPLSAQTGGSSMDFLHGMGLGALLGSLGAIVVIGTKASMPRQEASPMQGVVFATHENEDAWYYQDREGGTHGPFNRSMMNALLAAGARMVTNTYPEITDVPPAQPKTRITRPNVLQLDQVGFGESTQIISHAN